MKTGLLLHAQTVSTPCKGTVCVSNTNISDLQSGMHMNNCSTMSEFTPDASVVVASFVNEDGQQVGHQ